MVPMIRDSDSFSHCITSAIACMCAQVWNLVDTKANGLLNAEQFALYRNCATAFVSQAFSLSAIWVTDISQSGVLIVNALVSVE